MLKRKIQAGLIAFITVGTLAIAPIVDTAVNTVFEPAITAYAVGEGSEVNSGSRKALNQAIKDKVNGNKYAVEGGGTLTGAQLVKDGDILETNYNRLTSKARQQLVTDMTQVTANEVAKTEKKQESGDNISQDAITQQTQQNWIQELQAHPGVGSRMLTDILQTIQPDYASARYIIEPFSGLFNTLIAVLVILLMTFLTLTFVLDLSYINISWFQAMASAESGNGGFSASSLVSQEAKQAVQDADGGKVPTWTYFKKRLIGVGVLSLCLLFFVQAQVFQLVGFVLDLFSGILNLG